MVTTLPDLWFQLNAQKELLIFREISTKSKTQITRFRHEIGDDCIARPPSDYVTIALIRQSNYLVCHMNKLHER